MEKPITLTPADVIALFTLTPACQHLTIAKSFALFRMALLDKKIRETQDAYRDLLKTTYEAIRDLKNDDPLYAIYVEIVNTASPITQLLRDKYFAAGISPAAQPKIIPVDFTPEEPPKGTN